MTTELRCTFQIRAVAVPVLCFTYQLQRKGIWSMNALIVDDDYFVIKALETRMDWRTLQIEQVYTADNIAQARDIINHHSIHILISDIDMPQGRGLEGRAWIRDQGYDIQAIILTNYADFNYSQKAIELLGFEYFRKPIE